MVDLLVIGSGPGGYVAAIRAAQLGLQVVLVEKYATLGGTCLNVGCIPSKALLDSSEKYYESVHHFADHGIEIKQAKVDFKKMVSRKAAVVKQTCDGVSYLMKKNKIKVVHGVGELLTATSVGVTNGAGKREVIEAKNIIIATGSKPASLPNISIDKVRIISSTEALVLDEIPKRMVVIGGGVIGMEMASVYARLGSKVSVVEYQDRIVGSMDSDISKDLMKSMKKIGVDFYLSHRVNEAVVKGKTVLVKATALEGGAALELEGDYCLMAVGRKAYTDGLGLANVGIVADDRGRVPVNAHLQTAVPTIFAIGDVVAGAMLAHKAEEEGVYVAEWLAGQKPHIDYNLVPGVVYTWPEGAGVGKTEDELKANKVAYKVGKFPFAASGRARASNDTEGFVKVLADAITDEVLGVHMFGPRCADLIAEAVIAMEYRASAEDIARICHAHPTFSEAMKEAALAATDNRALHI
jgi:dihydrolipoamide dehydrogenase